VLVDAYEEAIRHDVLVDDAAGVNVLNSRYLGQYVSWCRQEQLKQLTMIRNE
jgi:hypothetical protein